MLLSAEHLTLTAGEKTLLGGVSLELAAGDRLAVTGPSGSGKTLLLRSLALLEPQTNGEVRFRDAPVKSKETPAYRARVMYLPQRPVLWPETVLADLRRPFALAVHRGKTFARDRAGALFAALGRDAGFLDQPAAELSGGERQLTALVRMLLLDPAVLLLDEPTAALDAATTGKCESLIADWLREQPDDRAYIWTGHDAEQIARMTDRSLRLQDGRVISAAPVEEER